MTEARCVGARRDVRAVESKIRESDDALGRDVDLLAAGDRHSLVSMSVVELKSE